MKNWRRPNSRLRERIADNERFLIQARNRRRADRAART
jgi:hypothetical protein